MATKNIVPNADSEGQLGTSSKFWSLAHLDGLNIGNDVAANLVFTPSANDTITLASAANGAFTITTVDTAAASANVGFVVDGNFTVSNVTSTITSSSSDITTFATTNATSGYTEFAYNTSTVAGYIGNGTSLLSGAANTDFIMRSESGAIKFTTGGGNLALTIDSSQNVGINNGQSRAKINIGNNSSGAVTRGIILENRVGNAQGTGSSIEFYVNAGDNDRCAIIQSVQETSGNYANLEFFTANNGAPTKRLTIGADGNSTFAGNIVIGTAGKGISFAATSDGGISTPSELLDDYEEGTWTPVITFVSGTTAFHSGSVLGQYTLVGRKVTLFCEFAVSNLDGASNNTLRIDGMPFNVTSATASCGYGTIPITGKTVNFSRTSNTRFSGNLADGGFAGIAHGSDASQSRTVVCLMYHI